MMSDISHMCWGLLDNATDLADVWINAPWRRREFGEHEIADLRAAALKLNQLLNAVEAKVVA